MSGHASWMCQEEEIKIREAAARACWCYRDEMESGSPTLPSVLITCLMGFCHHMRTKHLPLYYTTFIRAQKLNLFKKKLFTWQNNNFSISSKLIDINHSPSSAHPLPPISQVLFLLVLCTHGLCCI